MTDALAGLLFLCAALAIVAIVLASIAYTTPQLPSNVSNPGFISTSQSDSSVGTLDIPNAFTATRLAYTPVVLKGNNFTTNGSIITYTGSQARYVTWTATGVVYQNQDVLTPVDNVITIDLVKNFDSKLDTSSASIGYTSAETGPNTRKTFAFSKTVLMSPNDTVQLYATGAQSQNFVANVTIIGNALPDSVNT